MPNNLYSSSKSFRLLFRNIFFILQRAAHLTTTPPSRFLGFFETEAAPFPRLSFLLNNTMGSRHMTVLIKMLSSLPCSQAWSVIKFPLMGGKPKCQRAASRKVTWDWVTYGLCLSFITSPLLIPRSRYHFDHEHEVIPYRKQPRGLFKDFQEPITPPALQCFCLHSPERHLFLELFLDFTVMAHKPKVTECSLIWIKLLSRQLTALIWHKDMEKYKRHEIYPWTIYNS